MNEPAETPWVVLLEGGIARLQEVAGLLAGRDVPCQVVPPPPERASP